MKAARSTYYKKYVLQILASVTILSLVVMIFLQTYVIVRSVITFILLSMTLAVYLDRKKFPGAIRKIIGRKKSDTTIRVWILTRKRALINLTPAVLIAFVVSLVLLFVPRSTL